MWGKLRHRYDNNHLLVERKEYTGEYWPEVVAVWTELNKVNTVPFI